MAPIGFRTAVVTGATGGIGAAFAEELAARGADLVLVGRRVDALAALAAALRDRYEVRVETVAADLTSPSGLRLVERHLAGPAPIDLLVNSAGMVGPIRPLAIVDADLPEQVITLNVVAAVRLTRAAVRAMVPRRRGGVLNVASAHAYWPTPGGAVYSATKAFLTSFSQSVHGEVRRHGVHVTALCPGSVNSAVHERSGHRGERLGRLLEPARVARDGLAAVAAGRPVVVPGLAYGVQTTVARYAPALARRHFYRRWGARAAAAIEAELG